MGATQSLPIQTLARHRFQSQVAILFGGYISYKCMCSLIERFQSQVAILFGGYPDTEQPMIDHYQFQSQVAILFGGYDAISSSSLPRSTFQSQVAILFGGYLIIHYHTHVSCMVSIAGGDSFWGLRNHCQYKHLRGIGFNRRWRFFLGATSLISVCVA